MDLNTIYNEDCISENSDEGMNRIPDKSIDMILCDLPYGVTACKWDIVIPFDKLWEQYNRIITDNGAIVLFGNEPFSSHLRLSNVKMLRHEWYWNKINAGNFVQAKNHPLKIVENIMVFSKNKVNYYPQMIINSEEWTKILKAKHKNKKESSMTQTVEDKFFVMASGKFKSDTDESLAYPKNIITISKFSNECNSRHRVHPTQKPVELLEYLIKTYTKENEIVLDNCIGSGSTAIASINTNRKFLGFELNEEYSNLAKNRVNKHIIDNNLQDLYDIIA
jgi:site-specific DNA-methyltransferase (adenine-specific)